MGLANPKSITISENWLKHWEGAATPPPGWGAKPVTWVSREDAAAYCSYYNKRLP